MNGHRQAALMLHELDTRDRQWMLAQCAAGDRRALEALLQELRSLNMPQDGGIAQQLARGTDGGAAAAVPAGPGGAQLAALLAHEPASVMAAVLDLRDDADASEVLGKLDPVRRQRVKSARRAALAPLFAASLAQHVESLLAEAPPVVVVPPAAPVRLSWKDKVLSWLR